MDVRWGYFSAFKITQRSAQDLLTPDRALHSLFEIFTKVKGVYQVSTIFVEPREMSSIFRLAAQAKIALLCRGIKRITTNDPAAAAAFETRGRRRDKN